MSDVAAAFLAVLGTAISYAAIFTMISLAIPVIASAVSLVGMARRP